MRVPGYQPDFAAAPHRVNEEIRNIRKIEETGGISFLLS